MAGALAAFAGAVTDAKAFVLGPPGYFLDVGIKDGVKVNATFGSTTRSGVFAGEFYAKFHDPTQGQPFYAFCTDLLDNLAGSNYKYVPLEFPAGVNTKPNPDWVSGGIQKAAWIYNHFLNTSSGGVALNRQGAAVQLAIWNALYDTDSTVNSGVFKATVVSAADSNAITLADSYLTAASQVTSFPYTSTWWEPIDEYSSKISQPTDRKQGLIGPPVPEPTAVLASLGFLGFAFACRKTIRAV